MAGAVAALSPALSRWLPQVAGDGELAALGYWQVLVVIATLAAASMFGARPRDVLSLGPPRGSAHTYATAVLLLIAMNVAVSAVQYFWGRPDLFADLRPFVGYATGPQWLLALLVIGIGAPLSEEMLFRGFLQSALARSRLGFAGGALVSTALWTSLHISYSLIGILEVFLIGMLFSWLLWRTGSLRVAIFCHAVYNSLIVLTLRYVPLPA
jgi:membrane protease YdiL (CAAX protease family)